MVLGESAKMMQRIVRNMRYMIPAVLGIAVLVTGPAAAAIPQVVHAEDEGGGAQPGIHVDKGGGGSLTVQGAMSSMKGMLSAPGWLAIEGFDPRLRSMPGWSTLTRRDWKELDGGSFSGMSAPAQQGGGGLLVPFREPAPAFSRNVLITRDFSNTPVQLEPHMAVDPRDPNHIIVGVIDYNFPSVTAYTTFDGGETWEGPRQVPYLKDDLVGAGDPVLAFNRAGNPFMTSISLGQEEFTVGKFAVSALVSGIAVSTSADGGINWSSPTVAAREVPKARLEPPDASFRVRGEVQLPFLDKPWMSVGRDPKDPNKDIIYVTYTEFIDILQILYVDELPTFATTEVHTTIKLVKSEDGGKTWSDPIAVSPAVRRVSGDSPSPGGGIAVGLKRVVQGSEPHAAPDGTVYVSWMDSTDDDSQKGLAEVYVARSDDAGKTFQPPVKVTTFDEPGFRPRSGFFRYWSTAFPHIAVGPQGEVHLIYGGLNPGKPRDDGDVFFVTSTDRGKTWSQPKVLGGDESNSLQFFPSITTDPKGGIHVMWGDMRNDPVQIRYNIYYTASQDAGKTWGFTSKENNVHSDDTRVTDFPSNANKGFPQGLFIGDYFAIAASDRDVAMVWADTRLGEYGSFNQKVGFARQQAIPNAEVFISPPTGPGGQQVTVQGFNLQPNMNVFVQVGTQTVSVERTNSEGRFTTSVYMPIAGQGAQPVRVVDDSGNMAATSYFTEFGFGDIRDQQQKMQAQLNTISSDSVQKAKLQSQVDDLQKLVRENKTQTQTWGIIAAAIGGVVLVGMLATLVAFRARR